MVGQRARLCAAAAHGGLLDLACGRGRHALLAASWELDVVALDRDARALRSFAAATVARVRADAELAAGLPFRPARFGAVLVSRFLFRPLVPRLVALLRPGGLLLYETFTKRQRELGQGPRNPSFLLDDGELPGLFPALAVEHYAEGLREGAWLASLAARKPA